MEITLGESVHSVRSKLGMADTDYASAWKTVNTKAQIICSKRYGTKPLKEVSTLGGIAELKDFYCLNREPNDDAETGRKIVEILQVKGAAAWFIHTAVRRNCDKHKKALQSNVAKEQAASLAHGLGPTHSPAGNPLHAANNVGGLSGNSFDTLSRRSFPVFFLLLVDGYGKTGFKDLVKRQFGLLKTGLRRRG